jgi:hypothetical protein
MLPCTCLRAAESFISQGALINERSAARGLSLEQLETPTAARAKSFGALLGISIGCFVGMLPLLFIDSKGRDELPQQQK